jgi:uncharacterized protein (DUF1499 family)
MRILRILIVAAILLAIAVVAAGQAGLLRGTPPTDLGVRDGRLKPPSETRNSVSSQAALWTGHPQAAGAAIAPLALQGGDGPATLAALRQAVEATPGGRVIEARADYLRAEFRTRWLGFVDDAEFWLDPAGGVVQVRSASRIGREDFDVNRQRIEALRLRLAGG